MSNALAKFGALAIPNHLRFKSISTHAGKFTARVTKSFLSSDGSLWRFTERINKDGSVSRIIEQRVW